jgi:hypothetical protein
MKNPWTKKNPFMSIALSATNAMAGRTRGSASAAATRSVKQNASAATTAGIRQVSEFWAQALTPAKAAAPRRRSKRR